jgi:hypothetical protein
MEIYDVRFIIDESLNDKVRDFKSEEINKFYKSQTNALYRLKANS